MQEQLARGAETLASVKLDASSLIWLDSCDVQDDASRSRNG